MPGLTYEEQKKHRLARKQFIEELRQERDRLSQWWKEREEGEKKAADRDFRLPDYQINKLLDDETKNRLLGAYDYFKNRQTTSVVNDLKHHASSGYTRAITENQDDIVRLYASRTWQSVQHVRSVLKDADPVGINRAPVLLCMALVIMFSDLTAEQLLNALFKPKFFRWGGGGCQAHDTLKPLKAKKTGPSIVKK